MRDMKSVAPYPLDGSGDFGLFLGLTELHKYVCVVRLAVGAGRQFQDKGEGIQ